MKKVQGDRMPAEREIGLGLMGSMSIWHWVIVLVIVVLLFGRGKISQVMGDFANGIKSFKRGLAEDDKPAPPRAVEQAATEPVASPTRQEQRNA